ncbi:DUF11 domain-containing protein [Planotetraspora sp. A-T 1434]|uniref:DUF11 domain-containing protein n=1 Tax=Planotetraspora sp. A-T 1434 TaxID=2979219 RepID=UPI0021C13E56|nr:DUF11 domain-containing protein [Planotetraspora sp. A-T 1434]MCT9932502.1 DUF11 domain-containing protein [Planotetraspora sp. A-T 1434]
MRHPITKIASLALVAPLAGATFFAAAPASAAPASVKTVATKADDPYSVFKVKVRVPKVAKVNRKLTYKIDVTNTGPFDANYYWLGGTLPKGVKKLWFSGPKGTECDYAGRTIVCWTPYVLEVDDSDYLDITVQFKKGYTGKATAKLGAIVFDVPTGAEDLDRRALKELGYKSWFYSRTVTTKIVK